MLCKTISFYTKIIIYIFLFACSDKNNNEKKDNREICDISDVAKSDELEFGYLDSNNIFYPTTIFIYDSTTEIKYLAEMSDSRYGLTLKMKLKKIKNIDKEMEECVFNSMFGNRKALSSNFWFIDENCNNVSSKWIEMIYFQILEETDTTYVLTTQIFSNGKRFGKPIFFIDDRYFDTLELNGTIFLHREESDKIKIFPASQTGYIKLRRFIADVETCLSGWVYADTIETIVNIDNSNKQFK